MQYHTIRVPTLACSLLVGLALAPTAAVEAPRGLTFEQLAAIRSVGSVAISPDGSEIAYVLSVPRRPGADDDGSARSELHLVRTAGGESRPYVHGDVSVSAIAFTPDGRFVTYRAKRGDDEHTSLWAIPLAGGESRKLLEFKEDISDHALSPDGKQVAFVAHEPEPDEREKARDKGYKQEIFEEDWLPRRVWIANVELEPLPATDPSTARAEDEKEDEPTALDLEGSAYAVRWGPNGSRLAVSLTPRPLIDDRYMQQQIHIVQVASGESVAQIATEGGLGRFVFSPDAKRIAMIGSSGFNDPREGRLLVAPVEGGEAVDMLADLEGHVRDIAWSGDSTVGYLADVGCETIFGQVDVNSGKRTTRLESGPTGGTPLLNRVRFSADGRTVALLGQRPTHPSEVFVLSRGASVPARLTDSNPWLADVELASQEVIRFRARDGLELEGLLLRPLAEARKPGPLLLMVHGGPESHDRNGWVTSYSRPGQLAAARGYAVLYPNYRGSTGRGVAFAKLGQGDAAGPEFDDLVDAVDHLVREGIADTERVGILGGSYGGYATAWCSTRHTERFRAGVMFVGISNKLSKGFTTDIPHEDRAVHTRFDPWTRWQFSLERSPIYHAEASRTALLIAGGTADTRVHPSQSLQLYRALKLIGETPVRYVRYPGEGHGNRKAAARDDYARRLMRWMDHFVKDGQSELPPWELDHGEADDEE